MAIFLIGNTPLIDSIVYQMGSIEDCCKYFEDKLELQVDTETEGEFNFENKMLLLQLGDRDNQFVIDVNAVDCSPLRGIIEGYKIKYLHNAKFDYKFIKFQFGWELSNIRDTFLIECLLTNGLQERGLGLKAVVNKYCEVDLNKNIRKIINSGNYLSEDVILYSAMDVKYLQDVYIKQSLEIERWSLKEVVEVENRVTSVFADIEYEGLLLDREDWSKLAITAKSKIKDYEGDLDKLAKEEPKLKKYCGKYQGDLFDSSFEKTTSINWSSPLQVQKVFRSLGLKVDSSSEKEISKFQNSYPIINKFIDFKKQHKLASTYGEKFLENINKVTGRVHTEFWQILETNRVSSSNPNIQQIPSKPEYLACFKASKGWKLVGSDFAAQELRLIAEGSKEDKWLEAFNQGKDLHTEMALLVFDNLKVEDAKKPHEEIYVGGVKVILRGLDPRFVAKTINFMLAYGGSEFKLSNILSISVEAAKKIKDKYFAGVPKLNKYLDMCAKYGRSRGYIRSFRPYSGIRFFDKIDQEDFKKIGEIERASKNTSIQMSGAIMCKLALVYLSDYIKENKLQDKVKLCLQIHDAIYAYVIEDFSEEWKDIQERLMIEAGEVFIKSIPVKSDSKIMDYWSK